MHGLNYTILQLGSVYGPGAKQTNLISRFIDEALSLKKISHKGTGEEVRQYIYVKDVVKAAIDSFDDKYKNKKIILLGNEKITIADLMTEIKSQVNKNIEFAFKNNAYGIHYKSTPFSTEPNSAIQFQTKKPVSLEQGLKETIASIQTGLVDWLKLGIHFISLISLSVHNSVEAAGKAASTLFGQLIKKRPTTVLIPGGKSPIPFFHQLAKSGIDWNRISLLPTDERVVSLTHKASNTRMIQNELLSNIVGEQKPELIKGYPRSEKWNTNNKLKWIVR